MKIYRLGVVFKGFRISSMVRVGCSFVNIDYFEFIICLSFLLF